MTSTIVEIVANSWDHQTWGASDGTSADWTDCASDGTYLTIAIIWISIVTTPTICCTLAQSYFFIAICSTVDAVCGTKHASITIAITVRANISCRIILSKKSQRTGGVAFVVRVEIGLQPRLKGAACAVCGNNWASKAIWITEETDGVAGVKLVWRARGLTCIATVDKFIGTWASKTVCGCSLTCLAISSACKTNWIVTGIEGFISHQTGYFALNPFKIVLHSSHWSASGTNSTGTTLIASNRAIHTHSGSCVGVHSHTAAGGTGRRSYNSNIVGGTANAAVFGLVAPVTTDVTIHATGGGYLGICILRTSDVANIITVDVTL